MASHRPAEEVGRWQSPTKLWLDHARVRESDLDWMAPVRSLILWNVRLPEGALARLPHLAGLSIRGGSSEHLAAIEGCESLVALDVNQVRGMHDLSAIEALRDLELLSLYGLPRLRSIPSLRNHDRLVYAALGSLKGLETLDGLADAPNLETLSLVRAVKLSERDVERLAGHPTLREFRWSWLDVPQHVALPVVERMSHLDLPETISPDEWITRRLA